MINFALIKIELLVCVLICVLFAVDLCSNKKAILKAVAIAGSFGILIYSLFFKNTGIAFFDAYISDTLSIFLKILLLLSTFLTIILSLDFLKKNPHYSGEYFILLLSATLGMSFMVSSQELITLYVASELFSIGSYILCAYDKTNPKSSEAGIKYLLLGALASGIFLFGMSLVYGTCGSVYFTKISAAITANSAPVILHIGLVFILVALGFKVAMVPFHMWTPDVYEGAPTPIAAFFSVGTKIAGFAVLIRFFLVAFGNLKAEWGILMVVLSALTMFIGNLLAIPQTNIKRFMGYSSIAQAGYILMGLAMGSFNGLSASIFYLAAYLFSNFCAFAVIIIFSSRNQGDNIEDYRGLARRSPVLALTLLIAFMSLGGVPPLAGFLGKLYLFFSAVEGKFIWLVVLGVLMSVVSIYYYLMILKRVYIEAPKETSLIKLFFWEKATLFVCVAGIIIFGVFPSLIFSHIQAIARSFF